MDEYIERSAAVCAANYAIDEHPYDKDPARPETFSEYNSGWNDACDYIQKQLDAVPAADVAPVKHGRWEWDAKGLYPKPLCSKCHYEPYRRSNCNSDLPNYCPNCGAKMDGGNDNVSD